MKAEIITIGNELLSGATLDTNSAYLAEKLSAVGILVVRRTTVPDAVEPIAEAIEEARGRVAFIVTTGGLGPTNDDVTKKALTRVSGKPLVLHEEILKKVEERFRRRGEKMPLVNQNQALLPSGAKWFVNNYGTAPGILIEEGEKRLIALPGVPREMKGIFEEEVIPYLSKAFGTASAVVRRRLRTTGLAESALYEKIRRVIPEGEGLHFAFLPSYYGVDLRLEVSEREKEEAEKLLEEKLARIRPLLGDFLYAEGETAMEEAVGRLLLVTKKKLAAAESCTGGLVAKRITDVPGSSDYFERGLVTYANEAKHELLGVPQKLFKTVGAVSPEVATRMAVGVRKLAKADIGIGVTGIAGPGGGSAEKPVGLTYIALADRKKSWVQKFIFSGDREINRLRGSQAALNMVRLYLLGKLT
ncbi:MAG: competence/damage-inducible protein A [candidate division Zixibacteria bacterium]|nr:competence/damage-inducible protein A [candidate division Zixibacteria bacterium]